MNVLGLKVAEYWHVEMVVVVPLILYAIWRVETIVSLLKSCVI